MSAQLYPVREAAIPRLLIIGDIALLREGIENGLARTGEFQIVGSVDVREALEIIGCRQVDVAVLDTSRRRAASQARQLLEVCPTLKIVAFGIDGVDDALACAEAGVRAFVGEDGSVEEIGDAGRPVSAEGVRAQRREALERIRLVRSEPEGAVDARDGRELSGEEIRGGIVVLGIEMEQDRPDRLCGVCHGPRYCAKSVPRPRKRPRACGTPRCSPGR